MRHLILAAAMAVGLSGVAVDLAHAAPCRDPRTGHFIKCPPPKPMLKTGAHCRDPKTGHFVKCH